MVTAMELTPISDASCGGERRFFAGTVERHATSCSYGEARR